MADDTPCTRLAKNNFGVKVIYNFGLKGHQVNGYFNERFGRYIEALRNCTIAPRSDGDYEYNFTTAFGVAKLFSKEVQSRFKTNNPAHHSLFENNLQQWEGNGHTRAPNIGSDYDRFNLFKSLMKTHYTCETLDFLLLITRPEDRGGLGMGYNPEDYTGKLTTKTSKQLFDPDGGHFTEILHLMSNVYENLLKQVSFRDWESKYFLGKAHPNYQTLFNHFKYRSTLQFWAEQLGKLYRELLAFKETYDRGVKVDRTSLYKTARAIVRTLRDIRIELAQSIHVDYEDDNGHDTDIDTHIDTFTDD
jgi:hypothetical protein